jgi:hypothetical protein
MGFSPYAATMSGPDEPQYPGPEYQGYQAPPPGYPPPAYPPPGSPAYPAPAPRARLSERLNDRLAERPVPRVGVSLAGAGVALVIVGVLIWGFAYTVEGAGGFLGDGSGDGGSRHYLGAGLGLAVTAVGYALVITTRHGALATAGVAASALGVPVTLEFLTFNLSASGGGLVNTDVVVWVSIGIWMISYLWVRGAQGHSFYLALSLYALWIYLIDKAAPTALASGISFGDSTFGSGSDVGGGASTDFGSLAGVSLTIGAVYYLIAWGLDRSGRRGGGVSFVLVGLGAVAVGIAALAPDLKQVGTGVVLVVVGVAIAMYGARFGRRFTTWIWATGAALGGALVMIKLVADQGFPAIGASLVVLGAIFVCGGALLARLINEPDDVVTAAEAT